MPWTRRLFESLCLVWISQSLLSAFFWNGRERSFWSAAGFHTSLCVAFLTPFQDSSSPNCSHDISRTPSFFNLPLFSLNSVHSAHLCLNFLNCPHAFSLLSYTASCQHHLPSLTLQLSLSTPFSSSTKRSPAFLISRSFSEILKSLRDDCFYLIHHCILIGWQLVDMSCLLNELVHFSIKFLWYVWWWWFSR